MRACNKQNLTYNESLNITFLASVLLDQGLVLACVSKYLDTSVELWSQLFDDSAVMNM